MANINYFPSHSMQSVYETEVTARRWNGIPHHIKITTRPATIKYEDGDTILFTGIAVTVYDENDVPLGKVREDELIFPVTVVDIEDAEGLYEHGDIVIKTIQMIPFDVSVLPDWRYRYYEGKPYNPQLTDARGGYDVTSETINYKRYHVTNYEGHYYVRPVEAQTWTNAGGTYWVEPDAYTATISEFRLLNNWKTSFIEQAANTRIVSTSRSFMGMTDEEIKTGSDLVLTVPVQWINPYNGETLEDTYDVYVEEAE